MPSLCSLPASSRTLKSFHRQNKTSCHFIWLASLVPVSMHGGKSSSKQAASLSVSLYLCPLLCGIRDKLNSTLYSSLVSSLQGKCLSFRSVLKSEGQTKSVIDSFLEFFSSIQWYFKGCLCRQLLILLTWLLGTSFIFHKWSATTQVSVWLTHCQPPGKITGYEISSSHILTVCTCLLHTR